LPSSHRTIRLPFALLLLFASAGAAAAFAFETDAVRLLVDDCARALSLREEATDKEWLQARPWPLFAVKKRGRWRPSTSLRKDGDRYVADFGQAGISATYAISAHKDYILFELADLQGEDIEAIRLLHLRTEGLETAGHRLAVRWNDEFAVVPLALSPRVHASLSGPNAIHATVNQEFGLQGEKIALVAVPTERLMDTIQAVEKAFDLPSPTIDGQWAKRSDAVRTSYLFIDLTAWNVDEVIRYAKLGGFKYILIYAGTWASSRGSYPIKRKNFPLGERSLKRVVDSYVAWMQPGSTTREENLDGLAPRALVPSPVRPARSGSEPRSAIGRHAIQAT